MPFFQVLYGEKISSTDQGYPSPELLGLLKITSFPILEKGTPYADSGTESADPELNLFQVILRTIWQFSIFQNYMIFSLDIF